MCIGKQDNQTILMIIHQLCMRFHIGRVTSVITLLVTFLVRSLQPWFPSNNSSFLLWHLLHWFSLLKVSRSLHNFNDHHELDFRTMMMQNQARLQIQGEVLFVLYATDCLRLHTPLDECRYTSPAGDTSVMISISLSRKPM